MFKKDILDELNDNLKMNTANLKLCRAWINQMRYARNSWEKEATALCNAANGTGNNEDTFIMMLCTTTP
jgi:hypothetical protein